MCPPSISAPLPPPRSHLLSRVEAATGLVFRFIVGHGSAEDEQMLQAENSTHGDLFRVDVQESYLNLNHKILLFFTTAFKLYEAKFYVKIDDDIFLMPGEPILELPGLCESGVFKTSQTQAL
ncbi:unnamed protein product [Closterium sp. NIES-54]